MVRKLVPCYAWNGVQRYGMDVVWVLLFAYIASCIYWSPIEAMVFLCYWHLLGTIRSHLYGAMDGIGLA